MPKQANSIVLIKPGNIWHSPINVYWHIQKLTEQVGADAIEKKRQYQMVREARIGAIVALAMFQRLQRPTFLQLYKPDPPDLLLMQQRGGTRDIIHLEITTHLPVSTKSFLELMMKKDPPGAHKYNENYILAVNLGVGMDTDFTDSRDYLKKNKTPFPVLVFQEKSSHPDTIARVTFINPEIHEIEVNVGQAAHIYRELKLPGVIHSKRVGNSKLLSPQANGEDVSAPWDTIGL